MVHGPNHDISRGAAICFETKLGQDESQQQVRPPPCETFAIARFADMGWHCRTNPVPFRSAFELWGRHGLTPKEQRQVRTSNVLLIYAIAFANFSAIYGIANWTDHPDLISRHAWLSAPSIWITEQVRRLQVLPNVQAHHIQHCKFGGATRKPTRLMSVNMKKVTNRRTAEVRETKDPHRLPNR